MGLNGEGHIGSLPSSQASSALVLVALGSDNLDAHRRCGLRSYAIRCIDVSILSEARRHYGR